MNCSAADPPIFLCDAGWWCEDCFRQEAGVPDSIGSDDLHDGINDGSQAGYIEALKTRLYGEYEDDFS